MARFNRRIAAGLAGLAALQAGAYLAYRFVSGRRAQSESGAFAYESADGLVVTDLVLEAADGRALPLSEQLGRPLVLHFWATWCAPCRAELPTLLTAFENQAGPGSPRLLLVSVDENWETIRHYFSGAPPKPVVRDPHSRVSRQLGVVNLPETLLLGADGRALARVPGARNWQSAEVRRGVAALVGTAKGSN
jgi:thiol-disulfide isomerase/thioredoxin